jgi:hypothetical protein
MKNKTNPEEKLGKEGKMNKIKNILLTLIIFIFILMQVLFWYNWIIEIMKFIK